MQRILQVGLLSSAVSVQPSGRLPGAKLRPGNVHSAYGWEELVRPERIRNWSLTSLQQRLVKTGGLLVKDARYYWLLLAEGHLSRRMFGSMLRMIAALPLRTGRDPGPRPNRTLRSQPGGIGVSNGAGLEAASNPRELTEGPKGTAIPPQ